MAPILDQPHEERAGVRHWTRRTPWGRYGPELAGAMAFFCFMPYIAIPLGRSTAIQVGTLLGLILLVPLTFVPRRQSLLWIFPLLMIPLALAGLRAGITEGEAELCIKNLPLWGVSLLTILATQICAPKYALEMLTGIAVATVLHTLVGAVQFYSFSQGGEFPLAWLYINPSFLSVQENMEILAKYTQRPFGLFPEPSAMSSSLSPFVIFWIAEACGIVRLRREPRVWQRVLFMIAAVGGIELMIVSRSGHAAFTMTAVIILIAIWFMRCKATMKSLAAILSVFGVLLPLGLYFAALSLSDRMGGASEMGNSSWEDRANSLVIGWQFLAHGDLATLIFGLGPGMTSPVLQRSAGLDAVWSVLLTYVYETGFVGMIVVYWIGQQLFRIWKSNRFDVTFPLIVIVWLVGITITTSYCQLLTLWVALGWLLVWPEICHPAAAKQVLPAPPGLGKSAALRKPVAAAAKWGGGAKWTPLGWREPAKVEAVAETAIPKPPRPLAGWR